MVPELREHWGMMAAVVCSADNSEVCLRGVLRGVFTPLPHLSSSQEGEILPSC